MKRVNEIMDTLLRAGYRMYRGEDLFDNPPTMNMVDRMRKRFGNHIFYDYDLHILFIK